MLFVLAVGKPLPLFPDWDALPELDFMVKAIATEIQQGGDRQREIMETAKHRGSLMLSRFRDFGDDTLLKPDTCYCFSPDPDVEAKAFNRAASDDSADSEDSGSEDSDTYDENSDNNSNEDETDTEANIETETNVQCENTTVDPFRALNEISQYCAALRLKMIEQESISDSEMKTHKQGPRMHQCDHEGCNYSADRRDHLKRHKERHLLADQRLKRPKRKANNLPSSNRKRKKGDKE